MNRNRDGIMTGAIVFIVIALAVICCILFMNLVRIIPDAIKTGEKMGGKTYATVLALVVLVVLISGIMGRYRCDGCEVLGAQYELDGSNYCEECYENLTW